MDDDRLYRVSAAALRLLLRSPLASIASFSAKVILRHARTLTFLRRFDFDVVVDGGANIGEFAELVRIALPSARIVCIEPHPAAAETLRRARFEVVEAALWSSAGELDLWLPGPSTVTATVLPGAPGRPSFRVRALRLDDLDVRGRRVLVKLDLQGAEPQALDGGTELLARASAVLLEVSVGPEGSYEALRRKLEAQGFFEYSTLNELEVDGRVVEADKVFLRVT